MSVVQAFEGNDYGIVFYGSRNNYSGTYVDVWGQTRQIEQLTTTVTTMMDAAIASAYFHVGSASVFDLQVEVKLSAATTLDIGLVGKFNEPAILTGLDDWSELITEINTTGVGLAVHTLTASGRYMLQTGNLAGVSTGAIRVTGTFGDVADFDVIVRLRVQA